METTLESLDVFAISQWLNHGSVYTKYRVIFKKVLHKREEKMQEKIKMTQQKDENLVQVQQQCSFFLHKDIFQIMICLTGMTFWMSNFDDFDNDQISWKLAQR